MYDLSSVVLDKPQGDPRPYLPLRLANTDLTVHGLLDTGSVISVIGRSLHLDLRRFDILPAYGDPVTVITAGGQRIPAIGHILIPITCNGSTKLHKFYIVPEINSYLLLGIDFLNNFVLDNSILKNNMFMSDTDPTVAAISSLKSDIHITAFDALSTDEKSLVNNVIDSFRDFSFETRGLGRTSLVSHRIDTGEALPIRQRYYRMSPEKQRIITEEVDNMLSMGVVSPCESPWSSPVLLVEKKDGSPRFCIDCRKLNAVTVKDTYSIPYISEILDNLRDAKFLSSIDISKAFWQIPINEADREKTAFYIPGRGLLKFNVMPFGLTNAPATQQRLVDLLFGPEFENRVFCYLDDIIIVSDSFQSHVSLLLRVLGKLKTANLTVNFEKCQFFRDSLKYLGYVVDQYGLRTDPDKVEAIMRFPTPKSKKDVKRFLGTAQWYRRFIPNFSTLAGPLNALTSTKKNAPPFTWSSEADVAFIQLKSCLSQAPVLACPNFAHPFEVHTDASNYGIGGMLSQTIDGVERPVAYMSRSLSGAEKNYSVTERECLSVIMALEHWRCYLENGIPFTVYTDHSSLRWFLSINNASGRLARWGVRLSSFSFIIKHRKGVDNVIPDALSRAVPVSALDCSTPITQIVTTDAWYNNAYRGCVDRPASFPNFQAFNGKLFRKGKTQTPLHGEFEWKEVVPVERRADILREVHSEPTSGHFGIFKTYRRLSLRYYWPGMYREVVDFVATCDICLKYKHPNHAPLGRMGRPKVCSRPFQSISIDIVGPLPITRLQNTHLFVVTCCFSKYTLLFPLRTATALNVRKNLENGVFLIHGIPQTVILDNGVQFISEELSALFKKYKVPNIHFTPKYTPQVNLVERYNRTVMSAVATFVGNDHRSWDAHLSSIQFAMNASVNESTGYTPAFLVHGRELVSCGSHYLENDDPMDKVLQPRDAYAENLGALARVFGEVQTNLWRSHCRGSEAYNLRRRDAEFEVGDTVWKRTYFQSDKAAHFAKKLAPKFERCKVSKKLSPLVYVLTDERGKNIGSWHIKDLKLFNNANRVG